MPNLAYSHTIYECIHVYVPKTMQFTIRQAVNNSQQLRQQLQKLWEVIGSTFKTPKTIKNIYEK